MIAACGDQARFTAPDRHAGEEDELVLTSVGVDIGSSTSHLMFSRLVLQRVDSRYVPVRREVLFESEILLTPYLDGDTIDGAVLGRFVEDQYRAAGLRRDEVDTGALILTGVALLRRNARTIADLFAAEAGRFVAVSAGDNLEATMAAHGSGAAALSKRGGPIMNVDIGGGTTKVVICRGGRPEEIAVLDVGARLVACDEHGRLVRLEESGRRVASTIGLELSLGQPLAEADRRRLAAFMVERLVDALAGDGAHQPDLNLLRSPPLTRTDRLAGITISGGVSEYVYGRQASDFGDLGPLLAEELRARAARLGAPLLEGTGGIRATVIGASQYTVQVSGSTIYLTPLDIVPVRNVPVVKPSFPWQQEPLAAEAVEECVREALRRFDLLESEGPVALALRWVGSATFDRLDAFCHGVLAAMRESLASGNPLVLVCDGDLGGLIGLHLRDEMRYAGPIVSIDGIELREFDYIDIGALIPTTGAVPVVIKSLIFPSASPAALAAAG